MADAVVQLLIEKLSSLLEEEAVLLTGVRDEAEYMRDELERMKAFLTVADARYETDEQLKVWVNQVREVAYDTEDLLDKFVIRLGQHGHDQNGFYGCLQRICFRVKNLKARHEIATEIQRLKSRVTNTAEGHQRYRDPNLPQQSATTYNWQNVGVLSIDADLVVGIDVPKQQLVDWLVGGGLEDAQLKCISVVGMGGCGKTTLVQQVYGDAAVKQHFDTHLWLVASESFDIDELLVKIIQKLFAEVQQPAPNGLNSIDTWSLKITIADFLEQRRYVVVIDDVWNVRDWEALKNALPENNCGSRIMLTTRSNDIATRSRVDTNGHTYSLEQLAEDAAWTLFSKRLFRDCFCPPQLEEISRSILRRCEGLPLAIVTIAGVLSTKDRSKIEEWEMFYRSLPFELEGNRGLERIKRFLSLSYNGLPDYLKMCYLYMYIFPEDYEIERMMLIRLWTAEGFVQERGGKTVEEVAELYLHELVNRSLVQVVEIDDRGMLRIFHVHDVLREVILSRARAQRIVTTSGMESINLWPQKARRLAVHDSEEIAKVSSNKCFNSLRSFIFFRNASSLPLSKLVLILSSSKLLRVLNLMGVQLEEIPDEVFELVHLRYLSMRETGLKSLSENIGELQNLETLDLKKTLVRDFPNSLLKLRRLRHLLVSEFCFDYHDLRKFHYIKGCKVPCGIGGLLSLQKLHLIDGSNSMIIQELGKLTQLRRLGITNLKRAYGNSLCNSIAMLTSLRSLHIQSLNEDETFDIDSLSAAPLRFLQSLTLVGPLHKAPSWIHSFQNLVRLEFGWSKLTEDPLNFLHGLPSLRDFTLHCAYEGDVLHFKTGGFQSLKTLTLSCLQQLRWVKVEEHSMPQLQVLTIGICELMEELPSGIQHLIKLEELYLSDMPVLIEQFRDKKREHQDYWKIAHISRVRCAYVKDDSNEFFLL